MPCRHPRGFIAHDRESVDILGLCQSNALRNLGDPGPRSEVVVADQRLRIPRREHMQAPYVVRFRHRRIRNRNRQRHGKARIGPVRHLQYDAPFQKIGSSQPVPNQRLQPVRHVRNGRCGRKGTKGNCSNRTRAGGKSQESFPAVDQFACSRISAVVNSALFFVHNTCRVLVNPLMTQWRKNSNLANCREGTSFWQISHARKGFAESACCARPGCRRFPTRARDFRIPGRMRGDEPVEVGRGHRNGPVVHVLPDAGAADVDPAVKCAHAGPRVSYTNMDGRKRAVQGSMLPECGVETPLKRLMKALENAAHTAY